MMMRSVVVETHGTTILMKMTMTLFPPSAVATRLKNVKCQLKMNNLEFGEFSVRFSME